MPSTEEMKELFSERLNQIMAEHRINQTDLAKILGVSESTVGKWILKKAMPRMGIIQKLADHFRVGKSYFLEESYQTSNMFYYNKDAADYAERCRTDPNIRVLFSATEDITKEQLEKAIEYIEFLKSKER